MPRRPLDQYETPPHYIAALLGEVSIFGRVLEPCVGTGAIAECLRELPAVGKVITNDIDKTCKADTHTDARLGWRERADWIVTNPPFADELEILYRAFEHDTNVAFLARLSFLEPTEDRESLLESNPPHLVIILPRYSFRLNDDGKRQTDNVTCAWLVWYAPNNPTIQRGVRVWGRGKAQAYARMRGLCE